MSQSEGVVSLPTEDSSQPRVIIATHVRVAHDALDVSALSLVSLGALTMTEV